MAHDLYLEADHLLNDVAGGTVGTSVLWRPQPSYVEHSTVDLRVQRLGALEEFFATSIEIFRAALDGATDPAVLALLINDTPAHLAAGYHRSLDPALFTRPRFFRTDESHTGEIFEVQCPGSGWGDLQLMREVYLRLAPTPQLTRFRPAEDFAHQVTELCGQPSPSVLHLLDNASAPVPMRFHILSTQPPLRYWGYDPSVRYADCDFVRTHSFFGLAAENHFARRLRAAANGTAVFDLPPIVLFDQKAPMVLPFWNKTRDHFTDAVRAMFAYSAVVTEDGFQDVTGEMTSIADFCRRPEKRRRYYLKYAGSDVSRNWGSQAVFRLNGPDASERLAAAVRDSREGAFWLIQPERSGKETVEVIDRLTGEPRSSLTTAKWSTFYGPGGLVGIKTMHRGHFKVHGQKDTAIGLALAR